MLFCLVSPLSTVDFLVFFDSTLPFLTEVTNWRDVMWLLHADMENLNCVVVCVILYALFCNKDKVSNKKYNE